MAFLNTTTFPSPVPQEVSQAEIAFCDGLTENVQAAITAERARVQTVALGGTNATTAGGALTNLGAASAADLANRGRPVEFGGDFATWTATSTPPCTSLVDGMIIYGICYRQSDVGVTINLDGLGAKNSVSALGMSNHYWGAILAGEFCVWQWSATMNTWILLAPLRLKSTDVPSILGATQFNGLVACPQGISGAAGYNKTALGTNQATALSLGTSINSAYFGTVAAGTGAKLPATGSTSTPIMITIFNGGANALLLYPATGESIIDPLGTNLGANNPYSIPVGKAYVAMPGYADTVGIWMLMGSIPSTLGATKFPSIQASSGQLSIYDDQGVKIGGFGTDGTYPWMIGKNSSGNASIFTYGGAIYLDVNAGAQLYVRNGASGTHFMECTLADGLKVNAVSALGATLTLGAISVAGNITIPAGFGAAGDRSAAYMVTNQGSTAGKIDLEADTAYGAFWVFSTKTNSGPGGALTERFRVSDHGLLLSVPLIIPTATPASATATGIAGQVAWDADYIYVCVAANTWKRTAIATW